MILRFEQLPLSRTAEQRILVFPVLSRIVNRHSAKLWPIPQSKRAGSAAHSFRTILKLGTRDSEAASLGSTSIGPEPAAKRYVRPEDGPVTVIPVCPR